MRRNGLAMVMAAVLAGTMLAGCGSKAAETAAETTAAAEETTAAEEAAAAEEEEAAAETGSAETAETEAEETAAADTTPAEETEIQVFIAASLNTVMTEIAEKYNEAHPEVKITYNADSSGTLLTQIEEGYECDIFFSAAQKQMNQLEEDGLVVEGTRANVLNNQLVVVALKDSDTKVTGLENLGDAESIALAGGSVPAGKYTRDALISLGILEKTDDSASITTQQISDALGGVEISEQDNVSKVLTAVAEGSCEVGTTYYSDTYGYEDDIQVLETVSYDLTGDVIYPIARVVNEEADEAQNAAADDFLAYILSDEAKAIFDSYYFDTDV